MTEGQDVHLQVIAGHCMAASDDPRSNRSLRRGLLMVRFNRVVEDCSIVPPLCRVHLLLYDIFIDSMNSRIQEYEEHCSSRTATLV